MSASQNHVVLPSQVRHADALAVLEMLKAGIRRSDANTLVDASTVQQFDSSALAVLLDARREALAQGRELHVQAWPEGMQRLAKMYGVSDLLQAA